MGKMTSVGFKPAMTMIWGYIKSKLLEQVKAVAFIILYLIGFKMIALQSFPENPWQIALGVLLVIVGLALFLEGLMLGLMPLGDKVGIRLPQKTNILVIMIFGLLLGFGATLAEPAISTLRQAGENVTPWETPLLYRFLEIETDSLVNAVGAGVGVAVACGMARFYYGFGLKWFIYILTPVLLIMSGWFAYYAYHLQLFEFCSGYFYKESAERDVISYLKRKVMHLLVPLYVWNIVYALIVFGLSFYGFKIGGRITFHNLFIEPMIGGHQYGYNLCTWFVMPLFMAEMINVIFRFCCKRFGNGITKETVFVVFYLSIGMLGVWLAGKGYNKSWWLFLTKIMSFLAFYGLGRYYKAVLEKYFDRCTTWLYFFVVFSMQLAVICKFGRIPSFGQVFMGSFKGVVDMPYVPYLVAFVFF